jgi:hypothetical protein
MRKQPRGYENVIAIETFRARTFEEEAVRRVSISATHRKACVVEGAGAYPPYKK